MQAAGGVDQNRIASFRLARRDRVEHHRGRIGAVSRADHIDAGALRPDLELFDGGGAEGIGRADQRRLAPLLEQVRQLADRRRLAGAVDADDQRDLRMAWPRRSVGRRRRRSARISCLTRSRRLGALRGPVLDRRDDAIGRRDADVGRNQQLLERLDRIDVDRPRCAAPARRPRGRSRRSARRSAAWCARGSRGSAEDTHRIRSMTRSPASARCAPQHQRVERLRTSMRPASTSAIWVGDRQLDAVARAERERRARRAHALGDHLHAGEDVVQRPAARELDPDVAVAAQIAGAGQHEIAEAAQARERFALAARRAGQPRNLRKAARDQRRQRVVAEPEPFDDAGGDRDDVLHRAADLDADHIVAAIEAEVRAAELGLHDAVGGRDRSTRRGRPSAARARPRSRSSGPTARRPDDRAPSS